MLANTPDNADRPSMSRIEAVIIAVMLAVIVASVVMLSGCVWLIL